MRFRSLICCIWRSKSAWICARADLVRQFFINLYDDSMDAIDGQLFHIADVTFIGVDPDLVSIVIFGGRDPISIVIDFCAILFVVCGEVTAQCSNNGSKS